MNNNIKIAVVGAGKIAAEHIKAFRDIKSVTLSGITSRTLSKAEKLADEYSIPHVCRDLGELFEKTQADIVVVAVNVESMFGVSRECFNYSWNIFLEKPVGCNLVEAEQLYQESLAKKRNVYVALNRRFYSATQSAITDMASYDNKRYIHITDNQDIEFARNLGFNEKVLEYWMYANSVHLIDYFRIMGRGEIAAVKPVTGWDKNNPGTVLAKIEYESGDSGFYEGIWNGPGRWAVEVTTPERRWEMKPLEEAGYQNRNERVMNKFEVSEWDKKFKPGFRLQAEEMVRAVKSEQNDAVHLVDYLKTVRLINRIFRV